MVETGDRARKREREEEERERESGARGRKRRERERDKEREKDGRRESGGGSERRVRSANGGECKLETLGQKAGGRGPG